MTAREVSAAGTSRSKSGKRLFECADVVLDNKSSFGDAALEVEGIPTKVGGTSLYTGCLLLDCVVMESLDILLERGVGAAALHERERGRRPEFNQRLLDQFKDRLAEY